MGPGSSEWELPDGTRRQVGPSALIGRGPSADLRLDDPRVSTVHAELSWRPEGLTLIARGGRVRVDGHGVRRTVVAVGLRVELAPGLTLEATDLTPGPDHVVPDTTGRATRRYAVGENSAVVFDRDLPPDGLMVGGVAGHLLALLLRAGEAGMAWDALAVRLWPEDGALRAHPAGQGTGWTPVDERRMRNRFDQHLRVLRQQLDALRVPPRIAVAGGVVRVLLGADEITAAG